MKKELLTIALAVTMGMSLTACKGASKTEEKDTADTSEKTVEKTTIKKDTSKTTKKVVENNDDDEDENVSSLVKDDEDTSESESSQGNSAAYQAILDTIGYTGKANKFVNEKSLKTTSFAKYISGGIEIIEVGTNKDTVYEIIESAIYPLTGYTEEQQEAIVAANQNIPAQYAQFDWIEVTVTLEDGCQVVRFRYKDLDDVNHAYALPSFGHSSYTDLATVTAGYLYGGWTQK
ncbi:MAG: hypothetical protein Q4C49_10695 [Bacillota bacterium]|nr:hypothetical protein [Bacillota bacterium]